MTLQDRDRLSYLPSELQTIICFNLTNQDIKNLRLANKSLCGVAKLRLNRVFLSANPRNVEVFRAIAGHETFRKEVVEIIWDDAILPGSRADLDVHPDLEQEFDEDEDGSGNEPPTWFLEACAHNNDDLLERRFNDDKNLPQHVLRSREVENQMSNEDSWSYYQNLLRQQRDVLDTGADFDAFRYGVERFPSLRRVEITPAAHGWLYTPLFQTPMIRAFPYGFNYVIPRGWPCYDPGDPRCPMEPWNSNILKNKWRGFSIVLQQLARIQHQVSELLVNAHYLNTGLNCRIFEEPCDEYNNFMTLLQTSKFRRLDLDLEVAGQENLGWPAFRSTYLRRALANAIDLEHISIHADMDPSSMATFIASDAIADHHTLLRTVFPIDKWPHLKHFGLLGFLVKQDDLISLLNALPMTLRSVELSFLSFVEASSSNYKTLLEAMRDELAWHKRDPSARPRITVGTYLNNPVAGRAIWLQDEIEDFLYHGGENPFGLGGWGPNQVATGKGVVKDEFDPAFERPYVDFNTYMQLGYYKKTQWYIPPVLETVTS